jgi:hypothetical protein
VSIWNLTISVLCLLLAVFLLRRELQRRNRHWYGVRCLASLLSIVGLWGMALQMKIPAQERTSHPERPSVVPDYQRKKGGFLDIHWTEVLNSGQSLIIQGRFLNTNPLEITIRLKAFGAALDSVKCPSGKELSFTLQTIPKQTGKAVYQISVHAGEILQEMEPIPVIVQPQAPLKVLILSSYPDFENKFLDRWLNGNHISVLTRTRISRDRFEKTFINRPPVEFNRINDTLLNQFDLMICDVSAFASLSNVEQISVRRQVNEYGMGLLVRIDTVQQKKMFFDASFPSYYFPPNPNEIRRLVVNDSSRFISYSGKKDGIGIRFQSGTQPLIKENGGQIRVSSFLYGKGKIVCTTITNTFEWSLAGREQEYGWFWAFLIQKTAKMKAENLSVWTEERFPVKGHPVHFGLEVTEGNLLEPKVGTTAFYLRQQKNLPSAWSGIYWPDQIGWQAALHAGDRYFEWYVFEPKDWAAFSALEAPDLIAKKQNIGKGHVLLFFIFFMSGWSFLWMERKLSLI